MKNVIKLICKILNLYLSDCQNAEIKTLLNELNKELDKI